MPYMKVHDPNKAKPWCIHKQNPDGTPGEVMGCSQTETLADGMLAALHMAEQRSIVRFAGESDTEIEAYLAIWGDPQNRDSFKTYFDANRPPDLGLKGGRFLPLRLMYEHGFDGSVHREIVGEIVEVWFDKVGIAFRAILDRTASAYSRIVDEIRQKILKTSSASAEHLADFTEDGAFRDWFLSEVSLTSDPAESRMPAVALVRSNKGIQLSRSVLSLDTPPDAGGAPGDEPGQAVAECGCDKAESSHSNTRAKGSRSNMLTLEQLGLQPGAGIDEVFAKLKELLGPAAAAAMMQELIGAGAAPAQPDGEGDTMPEMMSVEGRSKKPAPAKPAEQPALTAEQLRSLVADELKKQQMTEPPAPEDPKIRTGKTQVNAVRDLRFDHLTPSEMALGYQVADAITRQRGGKATDIVSEQYLRAMAFKTAEAIEKGDKVANDYAVRSKFPFTRANEVAGTGQTGYGAEYAPDLPGTELWQKVRYETPLMAEMLGMGMDQREIPQGYKSETIPLETTDPTWYVAAESTDIDTSSGNVTPKFSSSKSGSDGRSITVAKLSVAIPFSGEEAEDSIIAYAPEQMRKIQTTAPEQMEYILINGDTDVSASTNINLIDGTPNNTTTKPSYTLLDGMLKLALVTNTANSRDGGALDEQDFLSTMKLMPGNYRQNRAKLLFVIDPDTGLAAANIPAVKTKDVFSAATLENGVLTAIWKVKVLESGFMGLANTAGKISATPGNNVKGRILLTRPDRWTFRWKRRLQIETDYNAFADAYTLVAHMRFGFTYFDTEASACSYDLTV